MTLSVRWEQWGGSALTPLLPPGVIWYNRPVMPPLLLAQKVLIVALEAVFLYALSRILFVWVLQALVVRRQGGGWFVRLLRLPGNMVHELSHAVGYILCGYRVKKLAFCVGDPRGRGCCRPGEPWSPIHFPWLATATAAVFPLILGTFALEQIARLLGVHFLAGESLDGGGVAPRLLDSLWATLRNLHYDDWRTYLFLLLGFSIGAEMAPSETDLRRSVVPLLCLATGLIGALFYLGFRLPDSAVWHWYSENLATALSWLSSLLGFGVLATALIAALTVLPALLLRAVRRQASAPPAPNAEPKVRRRAM